MHNHIEFDPIKGFLVAGVRYQMDLDADLPTLRREDGKEVAAFGAHYDPHEVLKAALDDRVSMVPSSLAG